MRETHGMACAGARETERRRRKVEQGAGPGTAPLAQTHGPSQQGASRARKASITAAAAAGSFAAGSATSAAAATQTCFLGIFVGGKTERCKTIYQSKFFIIFIYKKEEDANKNGIFILIFPLYETIISQLTCTVQYLIFS